MREVKSAACLFLIWTGLDLAKERRRFTIQFVSLANLMSFAYMISSWGSNGCSDSAGLGATCFLLLLRFRFSCLLYGVSDGDVVAIRSLGISDFNQFDWQQ